MDPTVSEMAERNARGYDWFRRQSAFFRRQIIAQRIAGGHQFLLGNLLLDGDRTLAATIQREFRLDRLDGVVAA